MADEAPGRLWGGRFTAGPSDAMAALSRSVHVDFRLAPYDIAQTRAHVDVLLGAGLLTPQEAEQLDDALSAMLDEVLAGTLHPAPDDEDVHSAVERELLARLGPLGGKVRAGRSRNDQVATDFKLYLRHQARLTAAAVCDLMDALLAQATAHIDTVAPGFTHLQHAQPVSFGHELAKHVHALHRDVSRLRDWDHRHDTSPLGAGALAGSSLGLDAAAVASALGFSRPMGNSIDAVSARDWVAEFLFIGAMIAVTLSRIGEEVVLWTSREFGWATLDDAWSTGSSIMPQKKNPDVAELARGKAGRLLGNLTGLLATLQSMPFAYNRDLQEDKEPVFDTVEQLAVLLPAVSGMIATLRFDTDAMADSAPRGYALATDIAEWLVRAEVPFREAHAIAGACVRRAEARGVELWDLSDTELRDISEHLSPGVRAVLSVRGSLESRSGSMGTAPVRVREQLAALADRLVADRAWAASTSWVPRTLTGLA